jgi:hypothetical protein
MDLKPMLVSTLTQGTLLALCSRQTDKGAQMGYWVIVHIPTRCLVKIVAGTLGRALTICGSMLGWRSKDLMIRVK